MMKPFNSRNLFDLSHEVKLTCNMGNLVPIMCEEVVPGDVFRVSSDIVIRMAPMLAPIMHNVNVYTHFFFVPNRIIFDDWESFITGGEDGQDATVAPTITTPVGGFATSSLADYLGIPSGIAGLSVSALPFRAYAQIYNDYYRDENLQQEVPISKAAGLDTTTNTTLLKRAWQRDFFTSALPFQQRGPSVSLPAGGIAPVRGNGMGIGLVDGNGTNLALSSVATTLSRASIYADSLTYGLPVGSTAPQQSATIGAGNVGLTTDGSNSGMVVDLAGTSAPDINDLRYAIQVQRFLEKAARGGARYIEMILSNFGVKSSDARLQRAEYLGGGKSPIMISDVLQTSADDNQPTPLATMAGHGFSAQRSHQFKRFFEEHGFIIGIMSIMPRTTYQQGLGKKWTRATRYSYYWPVFSHLGEQAILNKEIYAQGNAQADDGIFGYQPRYQEYRKHYSEVHGDFRSSLDFWHLGRIFNALPVLNSSFIECNPSNRIFAVTGQNTDHLWVDIYHKVKALRPIPKYGTPGYLDHD